MFTMEEVIPMSWLNQILLILSILVTLLSVIIQEWAGLTPLYISISWAIFIIILSVWLSCFLFQVALKANRPLNIRFVNNWLYNKFINNLKLQIDSKEKSECISKYENEVRTNKNTNSTQVSKEKQKEKVVIRSSGKDTSLKRKRAVEIYNLVTEINLKCIKVWYKSISDDKSFPNEAQELLKKLLTKLFHKISLIDKIKLTHKLFNVFLLHLKEYHRALRRVEKGTAPNIEEAFRYLHPGSRNMPVLEHMLHRMVTILAQEFLQWELTSSLPCKLLLSILAKRLLIVVETVSSPNWLFQNLSDFLLQQTPKNVAKVQSKQEENISHVKKIISNALGDGITSATAAVIPRSLPKPKSESSTKPLIKHENTSVSINDKRPTLHLHNLGTEHRGLWGQSIVEIDAEIEEDKISPVYEEPTDFATTIARLRNVLQQKSTVNTPLHVEEKSYVVYEGSQFTNLSIPWTEFHTALDGSQQLLYCIQFDDIEQRGVDLFETTTATVRRQYRDFAQLHTSLQEIPELAPIMSNLVLPKGGRLELENYLKTLTTRLASECPPQLRHFLRPSSNANKKADVVAPRFDKFLVKTVSGVFNTLRTVVPGFEIEQEEENVPLPTLMPLADIPWRFVENIKSKSLAAELQQLITERTEYSCVDSAYEAVDSMESANDSALLTHWWETVKSSYEEDLDDLDSHLILTCAAVDLICELLAGIGSNNALQQEAVVRWAKLLFGNVTEPILQTVTLQIFDQLGNMSLHNVQNKLSEEPLKLLKKRLLQELLVKLPNDVKLVFGEDDTLNILKYLLDSYEIKKINVDLNLQILDVLASQLLSTCRSKHSTTF
ncbi:uncharacterized protein LOC132905338 [Bombus pascuorum]|uniref:uncharacterized protein LOC132905338 n=1 Tax=Bombus pascuorum TaxID=65598 RepID=UPI00298DAAC2|nr:uncharacterized protein LOC132905338 [Bombus pascuorum]XP_060812512.1 uncharacterized protein LOC132905338 [Bombus pascuorum]XP_060812513.1 uncharacterized protein LOC132905338 [Bombus pascuorum]